MTGSLIDWSVVVALGGAIGGVSGLFGVGGGFLLVPALTLLLGIDVRIAVGSAVCQVLGPASTALLARPIRARDARLPLVMLGGLLVGVPLGAELLALAESGPLPVSATTLVNGTYVALMTGLGGFSIWETARTRSGRPVRVGWLAWLKLPPLIDVRGLPSHRISLPILVWFGLVVGVLSGLLGMSGGLVLVPGMVYLWGQGVRRAQVTTLCLVWLISFVGTIAHAWRGNVDLRLVTALLVGGTIGAKLGSSLAARLEASQLRERFGWLLLVSAGLIAFRSGWFG